ncbi:MAG TPA: hypothetical protein VI413_10715 [Paludibacter sp.]
MKINYLKLLLVFLCIVFVKIVAVAQVVNDTTVLKPENADSTYHWTEPVLQPVNIDSIRQQKLDSENYLKSIEILEDRLKSNRKELRLSTDQANDEAKAISNERKTLAEKKKFAKDEEKFLKTEKNLRDKEIKQMISERKELNNKSKELYKDDFRDRIESLDDKDRQIKNLESQWNEKRNDLKKSFDDIAEDERKLNLREVDVKNRLMELNRTKSALDLKAKQLEVEKQQTKLEIKKSKALLKK